MIAWPKVPPALLALAPTIPGWATVDIYDGLPVPRPTDGTFFTVGSVDDEGGAGTFSQEPGAVDGLRDESGEVRCELVVSTGDSDDLAARYAEVYALLDALDAALRADQSLGGVLTGGSTVVLAGDFLPIKSGGTAIRVPLSVQFTTRTP